MDSGSGAAQSAPPPPDGSTGKLTVPLHGAGGGPSGVGPGQSLGAYRIVRLIGRGGMGAVYEAEQEHPRRLVALKVIRPGLASAGTLRRFEHEAEVLGRLKHPGIAQVYQAGTFELPDGSIQPFFAMELVEGVPLTRYAAERNSSTRERLELIIRICEAVEHAHQKGVIHRDLKPGNILVDSGGQPKVLDFGVARVTDSDVQTTSLQTDLGQLIGTVPYMSPEQAAGDPGELDTRSDVYALGVVCFELLTGQLPYRLEGRMVHEAVRVIREEEPARLSSVNRVFRGDVETIVGKALEKDKAARYQSAGDLGADIARHLKDEPIVARPASTWYQARKFARRNKALVLGVGATIAALVLGVVGIGWQAVATNRALGRALDGERQIRRLLVDSSVSEARLARRHGGWREVMTSIDRALELGADDPASLLLLRLEAVAGVEPALFQDELARLRALPSARQVEGAILLWEAEPRFAKSATHGEAMEAVQRAVRAGLADADAAYARALLAATYDESIAALREVLDADPFHLRARQMLVTALLLAWDMQAAEQEARAWLTLERGSATARLALAIISAASAHAEDAVAIAEGLRGRIPDDRLDSVKATLRTMAANSDIGMLFSRMPEAPQVLMQQWAALTSLLGTAAGEGPTTEGARSPILFSAPPVLQQTTGLIGQALLSAAMRNHKAAAAQFGEVCRVLPNPLAVVVHAAMLHQSGQYAQEARVLTDAVARHRGTGFEDFLTFQAMYAQCYSFQALDDGPQREQARENAGVLAHQFMRSGPMQPHSACMVAWAGSLVGRPTIMRAAIEDWKTSRPSDPAWARKTAGFLYREPTSRTAALFVAAHALRGAPDDKALQDISRKSLQWVRRNAKTHERNILIAAGFDVPAEEPPP